MVTVDTDQGDMNGEGYAFTGDSFARTWDSLWVPMVPFTFVILDVVDVAEAGGSSWKYKYSCRDLEAG